MKEKSKKIVVVLGILVVIVIGVIWIIGNKKEKKIELENGASSQNVTLENIEFSNITSTYEDGVTTIKAKVKNNTKKVKSIEIEILLKDSNGKEITKMQQKLDNIEPEREKVLTTGVMGDYSSITDIEMRVIKE